MLLLFNSGDTLRNMLLLHLKLDLVGGRLVHRLSPALCPLLNHHHRPVEKCPDHWAPLRDCLLRLAILAFPIPDNSHWPDLDRDILHLQLPDHAFPERLDFARGAGHKRNRR